jgi:hypothetical protein
MKRATKRLLAICLFSAVPLTYSSTEMATSYELEIEFTPQSSHMTGMAIVEFSPQLTSGTKTFYLHGELEVESITLDEEEIEFRAQPVFYNSNYSLIANEVTFETAETSADARLKITYQGFFNPSSTRSPSDYMRIDGDGVFLRSYGYSLWFPVFLETSQDVYHSNFNSARFKIPKSYKLIFVGEKTSEEIVAGQAISTWVAKDVSIRDLQVTARPYETLSVGTINIYHLNSDKSQESAKKIAGFAAQLFEYYSAHYKENTNIQNLNLLEMPKYGDISSSNMVGISSDTFQGFEESDYTKRTIAHELVHPFVSVPVKRSDAIYVLATEGFPSYFHLMALKEVSGTELYNDFLLRVQNYYLKNKGVAKDRWGNTRPDEVPLMLIPADAMSEYKDDYILWGRTKLFFTYLLRKMGDKVFDEFAKELFNQEELTEAVFLALCENYLPKHTEEINRWLYTNDYPDQFRIEVLMK